MLNAVLIDDEDLAREEMHRLLAAHPEIAVVGEADNVPAACQLLAQPGYALVFLDIDLGGGNGFDLVPHVAASARIIFVTAHNNFALRAFEVNALDYLLKPVAPVRLAGTIRRIEGTATATATATPLPLRADDMVQVKTGPGAMRFVPVAAITLVTSQDNYSELSLADGTRLFVRQTMAAWEERLPAGQFLRVHRQSIVNLRRIEGFSHHDEEITLLQLAGLREPVRARRQHWPALSERLAGLGRPL